MSVEARSGHAKRAMNPNDPWDGNDLEAEIMRADHPFAVESRGTTLEEALAGLGLSDALARERPDPPPIDEVIAIVDGGVVDAEGQLTAEGFLVREDFASPEEWAISIRMDARGATSSRRAFIRGTTAGRRRMRPPGTEG
jgi:hypothetical protein